MSFWHGVKGFAKAIPGSACAFGSIRSHDNQACSWECCTFVLLNLFWHLQEEFISTVWDNNNLPPPSTNDATYNQPESLPTMQPQSSVAMHPDFGCALANLSATIWLKQLIGFTAQGGHYERCRPASA